MFDTILPEDDGMRSETTSPAVLSVNDTCRAKRSGFGDQVTCLEPPPHYCGYALHLGDEYLCLHPDHLVFADRTERTP